MRESKETREKHQSMVQRRPWKRSGNEDSLIARKIEKMATDAKESDTDDRMRPPKRRWTRPTKVNESCWNTEKLSSEEEETIEDVENIEYDEVERHTREKLKRWQVFQMKRGFTENVLNTFLEKYIMNDETAHPLRSRFWWSRESDMEDRGVMMAIRNHGLVQSARLMSQAYAPNQIQGMGNFPGALAATTSTNFLRVNDMKLYNDLDVIMDQHDRLVMEMEMEMEQCNGLDSKMCSGLDLNMDLYYGCSSMMDRYNAIDIEMERQALDMEMEMDKYNGLETDADKVDDSEGFLERAVTEAIKKKGLCARCVKHD